jgi:hypothetical protein
LLEDLENIFLKHQIQNLIIAENFHNGILLREILQTAFTLGIKTQMIADLPSVGRGDKNIAKTAFTCNNKYENE